MNDFEKRAKAFLDDADFMEVEPDPAHVESVVQLLRECWNLALMEALKEIRGVGLLDHEAPGPLLRAATRVANHIQI